MDIFQRDTAVTSVFERPCYNNQKMMFDMHNRGRFLFTGSQDNAALVFDIFSKDKSACARLPHPAHSVNSAFCHPHLPIVVTSTGQWQHMTHDIPEIPGLTAS